MEALIALIISIWSGVSYDSVLQKDNSSHSLYDKAKAEAYKIEKVYYDSNGGIIIDTMSDS